MSFLVLTQLLENMTEVVRKGIQEAQVQLQKANEERLLEEVRLSTELPADATLGAPGGKVMSNGSVLQGVLRQIPVVGSVLNWFSPVQASQKGRTFNLTAGRTDECHPRSHSDPVPVIPHTSGGAQCPHGPRSALGLPQGHCGVASSPAPTAAAAQEQTLFLEARGNVPPRPFVSSTWCLLLSAQR